MDIKKLKEEVAALNNISSNISSCLSHHYVKEEKEYDIEEVRKTIDNLYNSFVDIYLSIESLIKKYSDRDSNLVEILDNEVSFVPLEDVVYSFIEGKNSVLEDDYNISNDMEE